MGAQKFNVYCDIMHLRTAQSLAELCTGLKDQLFRESYCDLRT